MRAAITVAILLACAASLNAQEQTETGTIVFYREPHFAGSNSKPPTIFCDGLELAKIQNGTYFDVTAPAGQHKCTIESLQHSEIEVGVLTGKSAYVHVEIMPGVRQHFGLANTTQNEYDKQKARLKFVKEWTQNTLVPALPRSIVKATEEPAAPVMAPAASTVPIKPPQPPRMVGYASCMSCPAPALTGDARNAGFEGTLVLQVTVGPDGRASNAQIITSTGYADLDENAIHVVQTWRFRPALDATGTPISVIAPIEITFRRR